MTKLALLTMSIFMVFGLIAVFIVHAIDNYTNYTIVEIIFYSIGVTFSPFTPGLVFISSLIAYICLSLYKIQDFNHKVINIVGETKIVVFDKTGTLTETT